MSPTLASVWRGRVQRAVLTGAVVAAVAATAAPAPAAPAVGGPARPDRDRFYTYSGSRPLAAIPPGTVLRQRSIRLAFGTTTTPATAHQLLYRTTDQRGRPAVTVTTVIAPAPLAAVPRVVAYLSFYDGLDPRCDPSYTLAGGDAGPTSNQQAQEEELLISWYLDHGFVVTVPDFEGTRLHWMAGRESGYGTLDAVRATESALAAPASTPVGLTGYSGGAVAADWAAELAAAYAPGLHLVGVAAGGVPVNDAHLAAYVNGTDVFSAAIPGILLGLSRAQHVSLRPYLSAYGAKAVRQEQHVCIAEVFGRYPGLSTRRMAKPAYGDLLRVPAIARLLAAQTMGTAPGHPRVPMFLAVGNADGTGDGVMVAADVRALARHYCHQGVPVQYDEYSGAQHQYAGAFFEPKAAVWLQQRFDGVPMPAGCP